MQTGCSRGFVCASLILAGCGSSDPDKSAGERPQISAADWQTLQGLRYDDAPPPADVSNAVADDPAASDLGQALFFDKRLSGRLLDRDNDGSVATLGVAGEAGRVSCAGCHVPESGFVDTRSPHRQISLAARWTRRRTPTLLDVAFAPLYNWDGRRDTLWNQAIGVMESSAEFNSGRLFVAQQVLRSYRAEYEALFGKAPAVDDANTYPQLQPEEAGCEEGPEETAACRGKPGDGADYDGLSQQQQDDATWVTVNAAKSIGAYLRQLRCGSSRFDQWLDGDESALNASEQRGALLFIGKAQCVSCHSGPRLTDGEFHNVGLRPAVVAVAFTDSDDRGAAQGVADAIGDPLGSAGRFSDGDRKALPSSAGPELEGAFKTPGLRCLNQQPSFMHTGQLRTLAQVVAFFDRGGDPAGSFPGTSEIHSLDLSESERDDLLAFLSTLDGPGPGAQLLTNPNPE